MAKGEDEDGLLSFFIRLFIGCIQSSEKEIFINAVIALDENYQKNLMALIQEGKI